MRRIHWTAFLWALTLVASVASSVGGPSRLTGQELSECHPCALAGYPFRSDVDGDWTVGVSDAVYLLRSLFLAGPAPACPTAGPGGMPDYFAVESPSSCCVACGDANGDRTVDLADPMHLLFWTFAGGVEPECRAAEAKGMQETSCPALLVVDGAWVEAHLSDDVVQLVDVRSANAYTDSHIPGAVRVDVGSLRATVEGVSGQVAPPDVVEEVFRAAGIEPNATVVVYGSNTDTTTARLFWTLEYYGHPTVHFLDGGWEAWTAASRPVETEAAEVAPSEYSIEGAVEELRVTADWIADRLEDPTVVLVDARSSGEYDSGHIPGALSIDWTRNVSSGRLRSRDEVAALYEGIDPGATLVTYCQTGSRASVAYLVLRWLGFDDVRLYDGSWAEWGPSALPRESD